MDTPRSSDSPGLELDDWLTGLTDHELERVLDRLLAEITVRRGMAATAYVGEALMRRFA